MPWDDAPVDPAPPRRRAAIVLLVAGSCAVTLLAAAAVWVGLTGGPRGVYIALPWDPANPARGCGLPHFSQQQATDAYLDAVRRHGSIVGQAQVASANFMSGGAYDVMFGTGASMASEGCVWAFELHGRYSSVPGKRPPAPAPGRTPSAPSMQRLFGAITDPSSAGSNMTISYGHTLCSGMGTPCPTSTPPPGGWPTAIPVESSDPDWWSEYIRPFISGSSPGSPRRPVRPLPGTYP